MKRVTFENSRAEIIFYAVIVLSVMLLPAFFTVFVMKLFFKGPIYDSHVFLLAVALDTMLSTFVMLRVVLKKVIVDRETVTIKPILGRGTLFFRAECRFSSEINRMSINFFPVSVTRELLVYKNKKCKRVYLSYGSKKFNHVVTAVNTLPSEYRAVIEPVTFELPKRFPEASKMNVFFTSAIFYSILALLADVVILACMPRDIDLPGLFVWALPLVTTGFSFMLSWYKYSVGKFSFPTEIGISEECVRFDRRKHDFSDIQLITATQPLGKRPLFRFNRRYITVKLNEGCFTYYIGKRAGQKGDISVVEFYEALCDAIENAAQANQVLFIYNYDR